MSEIIEVKNITKYFERGKNNKFAAVDNISFNAEKGDFISIKGKSGSGKSTLLNIIAGLITPDSGKVFFNGKNISHENDKKRSKFRNQYTGYISQGTALLGNLTVKENIALPAVILGDDKAYEKAEDLLKNTGLFEIADDYPKNLSGGETRRVSVLRAIINDPLVITADEPTNDLDDENKKIILDMLKNKTKHGSIVIMSTHDETAAKYANKEYFLEKGKLI